MDLGSIPSVSTGNKLKNYKNTFRNGRNERGLIHKMIDDIKGTMLALAFVKLRGFGMKLCVTKIDGEPITKRPSEKEDDRVCVEIVNGYVKNAWVG